MSKEAEQLLEAFEKLPMDQREQVVQEILRRLKPENGSIELGARGINEAQAADLRVRLKTFAEDWDRPEMDIYDEVTSI